MCNKLGKRPAPEKPTRKTRVLYTYKRSLLASPNHRAVYLELSFQFLIFYRVRHSHTCNTQVASCFSQPYCILRSKEIMLPWTKYPVIRFLNNGWFSFSWWMKRISELSKRNEALCCLHLFLHVLHVIWSLKTQKYQCRLLQYWKNIECQLPPTPPPKKVW
jgi:hypothetical protein